MTFIPQIDPNGKLQVKYMTKTQQAAKKLGLYLTRVETTYFPFDSNDPKEWHTVLSAFIEANKDNKVYIEREYYGHDGGIDTIYLRAEVYKSDAELKADIASIKKIRKEYRDEQIAREKAEYERLKEKFG